jgi:hypothetical protein
MGIELSEAQLAVLRETRAVETPAEFQELLQSARPQIHRVVREVMEPSQPVPTTLTELRDLYLTVIQHKEALDRVTYVSEKRDLLRAAIRLLDTGNLWFGEGNRTGAYRTRPVDEVLKASKPWRARIKAFAAQAFAFEDDVAEQFADVNTSGTLAEETSDLAMLLRLSRQHEARLTPLGMTPAFLREGEVLLEEASGRDLLGILGLRSREDALTLRNTIVTYATLLGREARAAGINACWDDPEAKRRFDSASFRNALRRLRPRRRSGSGEEQPPADAAPPATPPDANPPNAAEPTEP